MTRGQETLIIDMAPPAGLAGLARAGGGVASSGAARPSLRRIAPTPEEQAAHDDYLAALDKETKGRCLWRNLAGAG
jgi:DNA polymerase-3 subunit epsilon